MKRSFIALSGLLIAARVLSAQTINDFFDGSTLQEFRLTMAAADRGQLRELWQMRDFRVLLLSRLVSNLGNGITPVEIGRAHV